MRDKSRLIAQLERLARDPAATPGEKANALSAIERLMGNRTKEQPKTEPKKEHNWWEKQNAVSTEVRQKKPGTIFIVMPEYACTEKQYRFVYIICRYYGFPVPPRGVTFEFASDFLNRWADPFREAMGWSTSSPITGYEAKDDYYDYKHSRDTGNALVPVKETYVTSNTKRVVQVYNGGRK